MEELKALQAKLIECRQRQARFATMRNAMGVKQEHRHEMHILNKIKELRRARK